MPPIGLSSLQFKAYALEKISHLGQHGCSPQGVIVTVLLVTGLKPGELAVKVVCPGEAPVTAAVPELTCPAGQLASGVTVATDGTALVRVIVMGSAAI